MYRVEYKNACEIAEHYSIIGELSRSAVFCECILIEGNSPTAIVLNTNMSLNLEHQQPLKKLVRCYIIKERSTVGLVTVSEIIDRYR